QNTNGEFQLIKGPWERDAASEDVDALFFDADSDGDQDLYILSGSNEFPVGDNRYQDRLYINEGNLQFSKPSKALPDLPISGSTVTAADYDQDGDLDLFVGSFCKPGSYPMAPQSLLLRNEGGSFKEVANEVFKGNPLEGMVRDAEWSDWDQDGDPDLIVVGEWMNISFFQNDGGQLTNISSGTSLPDLTGIYFTITTADIDQDGDDDYLIGGLGQNHRYQASQKAPFQIYAADFDKNGRIDPIMASTVEGRPLPVYGRTVLGEQMPFIKKKFPNFNSYAQASIQEIFEANSIESGISFKATNFASLMIENVGGGKFKHHILPAEAQISAVRAIVVNDFNGDGHQDLLMGGNYYDIEFRSPRLDASIGILLQGDGKGNFQAISPSESGWQIPGRVRSILPISGPSRQSILVIKNNQQAQHFTTNS
ncbi:MAG: VCBS repeat-containing protein, partial [Bacteroidota bacterium]